MKTINQEFFEIIKSNINMRKKKKLFLYLYHYFFLVLKYINTPIKPPMNPLIIPLIP